MTKPPLNLGVVLLTNVQIGDEVIYPRGGNNQGDATGTIVDINSLRNRVIVDWDGYGCKEYNRIGMAAIMWLGPMIAENIE